MKLKNIIDILDKISPFELQDDWDSSGFSIGNLEDEIENIYVSLDASLNILDDMKSNSLLITHHPLLFRSVKKLDFKKYPANLVRKAIKKDISIVSLHTNFDKSHLNRYVVEKVLGFKVSKCKEFLCYFEVNEEFELFAKRVAKKLKLPNIKVVKTTDFVKTAAICVGAGADLIQKVEVDCYLTGDIKYHEAKDALESEISLIDIKHYESEIFFAKILQEELKNYSLQAIIANPKNPFTYIKEGEV